MLVSACRRHHLNIILSFYIHYQKPTTGEMNFTHAFHMSRKNGQTQGSWRRRFLRAMFYQACSALPSSGWLLFLGKHGATARQLWSSIDLIPLEPSTPEAHRDAGNGKFCLMEKQGAVSAVRKDMHILNSTPAWAGNTGPGKGIQEQQEF